MVRETRTAWVPLVIAVVGVAIVLVQWMGARPLWLDEEMIALNFRDRSLTALGGRLWLDQSAPLGWLAVQRGVLVVFGSSELALRAVPAFFGVATVIAALVVGRRQLTTAGCAIFVLLCSIGQWMSHHAVELKPYSADTFSAIVLPALAVAAAGASSSAARRNTISIWALAAAIGHWFSLGALLVLPACFVLLTLTEQRDREGLRRLAVAFTFVVASFALHYVLAIRHTQGSESLQEYWKFALPPQDAGVTDSLRWVYSRLSPIAQKPGGTVLVVAFWIAACVGFLFAPARLPGVAAGLVVLSGLALGALRVMPIYERLSLWFLPALYLGIALSVDRGVWLLRRRPPQHSSMNLVGACAIMLTVGAVCLDIVERGIFDLRVGRPRDSNHATDDRGAIGWMMQQRQPGDILITTHHAQPAIWWYGGVTIAAGQGQQFSDGGGIFTAELRANRRECRGREPERVVTGRQRVHVYFGFPDSPPGLDDLLLERLSKLGAITALRHFPGTSRAAVIDPAVPGMTDLFWEDASKDTGSLPKGCVAVRRARVW